jgi:hypothetical protein
VNADERDKLLDLHRAAMKAEFAYGAGLGPASFYQDDAFRDYLMSLEVTE